MRLIFASLTALGLTLAAPAAAQSVGMTVVDTAGAPVGTVTAIKGDNLQVKTDKHEALLPKSSFTVSGNTLLFASGKLGSSRCRPTSGRRSTDSW